MHPSVSVYQIVCVLTMSILRAFIRTGRFDESKNMANISASGGNGSASPQPPNNVRLARRTLNPVHSQFKRNTAKPRKSKHNQTIAIQRRVPQRLRTPQTQTSPHTRADIYLHRAHTIWDYCTLVCIISESRKLPVAGCKCI
jgi:hypothetical protein